ncbi:hypothetical protein Syun_012437 [Stephania yunnanensis]|uniref:Uncharacterized protein n=1 Tax=Stephania yunnanensis TaxID=152371 RepID=A0AAP0JZJ2_9MAGN
MISHATHALTPSLLSPSAASLPALPTSAYYLPPRASMLSLTSFAPKSAYSSEFFDQINVQLARLEPSPSSTKSKKDKDNDPVVANLDQISQHESSDSDKELSSSPKYATSDSFASINDIHKVFHQNDKSPYR